VFAKRFLRIVVYLLLAICVVAGVTFAATKYWLLPSIHLWKEPITQALSQAAGAPVQIGHIRARWRGISPELELEDVAVFNTRGHEVLSIPHAVGQLKLSSLWARSPHFAHLSVTDLRLLVSRDQDGDIDFFSQSTQADQATTDQSMDLKAGVYRWLSQQGRLQIKESHVVWQDLTTEQPPLALQIEHLNLQQQHGTLQINGLLSSLRHAHTQLRFNSEWQLPPNAEKDAIEAPTLAQGQLRVQLEQLQPSAWRRWVDMPSFLYQGTVNADFLLDIKDEALDHAKGSVSIERPFWADGRQLLSIEPQPFFQARAAEFHFELDQQALSSLGELTAEGPVPMSLPGAQWRVQLHDLNVHVPDEFASPLFFKHISLNADSEVAPAQNVSPTAVDKPPSLLSMDSAGVDTSADGGWRINELAIDTGAGRLQLQGALRLDAEDLWLSEVDLKGEGEHIALAKIHQYFPNSLDPDLRDWLQEGLTAGEISQLHLQWQGLLDDFEYYQTRDTGQFQLQAQIQGATIDYYPATADEAGWPAITGLDGALYWQNDAMRIEVDNEPSLQFNADRAAHIHRISAHIVDLYEQADLRVDARGQAPADDFFLLWSDANLGVLLEDTVEVRQLSGADWQVELLLDVPLGLPEEEMEALTKVQGTVHMNAPTTVALWPEFAPLSQMQGKFGFSEIGVHDVEVSAQWLGGDFSIRGGLGAPETKLHIHAHPHAAALQDFYEHPAVSVLDGDFAVAAVLHLDEAEHLVIAAQSDLQGLSIDLPAPLQKTKAEKSWPVQLDWRLLDDEGDRNQMRMALQDRLYGQAILDFEQHQVEALELFSAPLPEDSPVLETGQFRVDVRYPFLDIDAWWDWLEHIDADEDPAWDWPAPTQVRLQADEIYVLGFGLEYFTYAHQQHALEQWRADISSDQIAGTVFWDKRTSGQHPFGHVDAHFHRFDVLADFAPKIGVQPPKGGRVITKGDLSQTAHQNDQSHWVPHNARDESEHAPLFAQLPAVSLKVDEFNVGGYELGVLTLDATGLAEGVGWAIDDFTLDVDEAMHTLGNGRWAIWGAAPGLALQWESEFDDLGAYADYLGLAGYVEGGQGQVRADFYWPYLPWRSHLEDIQGQIEVDIENGRLQPIQSRSAKLLEFLSLQSLSRIARLDLDVGSLLKEGFPFHLIQGEAEFKQGWVQTDDYQVVSPVGSLLFEGRTHLQSHQLDAQALVIPELDVSGAALAAGIAVNPIVGMGALLAQWILKHPLSKAMTVRYHITGDWDDYSVEEIAADELLEEPEDPKAERRPLPVLPLENNTKQPESQASETIEHPERQNAPAGALRVRSKTKLENTHPQKSETSDEATEKKQKETEVVD